MKINFFEGGRRLVILIQALILCWAVGIIFLNETYGINVIYETRYPTDDFRLSEDQICDDFGNDASETISRIAENKKPISVKICFKGQEFSTTDKNGAVIKKDFFIPFKENDEGMLWGTSKYSQEGISYTKDKAKLFILPPEGYDKYQEIWWEAKFKQIKEVAQYSFFSIIGLAIFSMVLGWIARGFFGIKSGSDFRSDVNKSSSDIEA